MEQNLFLMSFRNTEDFQKVKMQGIWLFHNQLVLMADWDFHQSQFWVHFSNLPKMFRTKEYTKQLADLVGDFVKSG